MIALQVASTSFGIHLRECMGSYSPPPLLCSNSNSNSNGNGNGNNNSNNNDNNNVYCFHSYMLIRGITNLKKIEIKTAKLKTLILCLLKIYNNVLKLTVIKLQDMLSYT